MRFSNTLKIFKKYFPSKQKNILLIPGPITTSQKVKESMSVDIASREHKFIDTIETVQKNLLDISKVSQKNYTCVLLQGCGTFANESVVGNFPYDTKMLTMSNGIYGHRIHDIAEILNVNSRLIECDVKQNIKLEDVERNYNKETHISIVHHETSNGIVNDVEDIAEWCKKNEKVIHIDGISAIGGIPIEIEKLDIDYYVGSSNKCLNAFPGVSFVIAKKKTLEICKDFKRSLSLDLYGQYKEFETSKQFRFTPPPQIVNSLNTSINELNDYGGVEIKYQDYLLKNSVLRCRLENYGLESYISNDVQGPIMVLFKYPWKDFSFYDLYLRLLKKNIVIYSAQIKNQEVFRLGNIGDISLGELNYCIDCILETLDEMKEENKIKIEFKKI